MPAKKRIVVFDFDGVIADSFDLHIDCWKQILGESGAELSEDALLKPLGWSSLDTARLLVKEAKLEIDPVDIAERKMALFRKRAETELEPMAGAADAVARVAEEFYVAVTSGRRKDTVEGALERFGLAGRFDEVLTSDDLKPKDELDDLLTMAFERLDVKKGAGVMVDDSRNGLLAAERAGMKSVAFDSNPRYTVDYSMADAVIGSLDELQPQLLHATLG